MDSQRIRPRMWIRPPEPTTATRVARPISETTVAAVLAAPPSTCLNALILTTGTSASGEILLHSPWSTHPDRHHRIRGCAGS